jgi:dihydropyrimidinase
LPGADADVVVWDPNLKKAISADKQMSVIDYNVFEGIEVQGLPRFTLSRGEIVATEGNVAGEPGRGRFVKRDPFTAEARALARFKDTFTPRGVAR